MKIIEKAVKEGRTSLSEYEAKQVLATYQIPVPREILVDDVKHLVNAAEEIGYPLVLKGCSSDIAHKTEKGLIRLDIRDEKEAGASFEEIMAKMDGADRGMEAADLDMLAEILINLGRIGLENDQVKEIDINPVIISGNKPVGVDALVILEEDRNLIDA